ncbi:hypothetical protein EU348_14315 [Chryseobacterium indologenes]|uniref:Uncharacterized protein n=1 Tax=Chryseobacterium indologenes TaxID=253 RepID=A0A411DPJ0_CHRID|nr:hypothetical protein EU348_14315 [Chryseobacterium indologenes]
MNKILFLIALCFLFSCKKESKNESGLSDNLYNILIEYQKKNPIPSNEEIKKTTPFINPENAKYIYEVVFDVQQKDTLLHVTLVSGVKEVYKPFGVYKDAILMPTYVIDVDKVGQKLIKEYKKNDLSNFTFKDLIINDAMYPEYIYKIKGQKLILSDSIRGNMMK